MYSHSCIVYRHNPINLVFFVFKPCPYARGPNGGGLIVLRGSAKPRLAIFTINGTSEPQVVRLFLTTTCSCPAKSNYYHILAARMAVGIHGDSSKRTVNLTQLHKNTRKYPDKTSRHKLPRLDNVQEAAGGDPDYVVAAALHAAVSTATEQTVAAVPSVSTAASAVSARLDICHTCGAENPPTGKSRHRKFINWVCCDECGRWYHMLHSSCHCHRHLNLRIM